MKLILWLFISFIPGILARPFKPGEWYASLPKAPWTPPNIVFPIVWTILYTLMGVSAWLVFRGGLSQRRWPLALFLTQLVLNAAWSWVFFGKHYVGWGLIDLLAPWLAALAVWFSFRPVSTAAAALWVPYLVWLTIAVSLNGYIWLKLR